MKQSSITRQVLDHTSQKLRKSTTALKISGFVVKSSLFISTKELFCPISNCSRSDSNSTKKPFKTFKLLKQHFLIKHQQKSFKCDQCTSHFHDSVALKSHVQVCGKLVCQTCSKSYRATDGLEKHLRAHKAGFQIDTRKSKPLSFQMVERNAIQIIV